MDRPPNRVSRRRGLVQATETSATRSKAPRDLRLKWRDPPMALPGPVYLMASAFFFSAMVSSVITFPGRAEALTVVVTRASPVWW